MGGRIKALILYYLTIIGATFIFIINRAFNLAVLYIVLFYLVCPIFAEIIVRLRGNRR
jgi:hypothetical protein